MNIPELQPIRFTGEPTICNCSSKDSQLAQAGDITQFQFELEVCDYQEDLITNGDFDDVAGTGWVNTGFAFTGEEISSDASSTATIETNTNTLGHGKAYQLEIDITICNGSPLLIYMGDNLIKEVLKSGSYQIGGICETNNETNSTLRVVSTNSNTTSIERIACYMVENNFALMVDQVDTSTKIIRTLADDIADANYTFFRIDKNTVTVTFDWAWINDATNGAGLDYGCYKFGIAGLCDNPCGQLGFLDGGFDIPVPELDRYTVPFSRNSRTNTPQVVIENGTLRYDSLTLNSDIVIEDSEATSCTGKSATYDVVLDIKTITNCSVYVRIGGALSSAYTTTGVKSFQLVSINADSFRIEIVDDLGYQGVCELNSISATMDTGSPGSWVADYESNVFNYKEEHRCSLLVATTNNEDAYGLKFGSAFYTPRARFKGSLRAAKPDTERDLFPDEFGRERISYFKARFNDELRLDNVPKYLVEWLSLSEGMNKVWVDTVEKTVSDTPDLSYNRFCDNAKVGIMMGDARQEIENVNREGELAVTDYENILVRLNDEKEPLIWLDGEQRAIKG